MYVITVDNQVQPDAYVSLVAACSAYGLGYDSANRGKRKFISKAGVIELHKVELVKIKGRGDPNIRHKRI